MNKILCNDIVSVNLNYTDESYPLYTEWLDFYSLTKENFMDEFSGLTKYFKSDKIVEDFIVEWIAPHLTLDKTLYLIKGRISGYRFLVGRKVIKNYYHTYDSFDNSETLQKILIDSLHKNNIEKNELKKYNSLLMEENKKLRKVRNNLISKFDNGIIGMLLHNDMECWFVAIKEENMIKLIYENGGYDCINENQGFDLNGIWKTDNFIYARLMILTTAVSFDYAKKIYHNLTSSNTWKEYDSDIYWLANNLLYGGKNV